MEKVPDNIRPKIGLWKIFPYLANKTAHGVYPYVYLPVKIYDDILSTKPNPWNVALLIHEEEHLRRQIDVGPILWLIKYLVSPKFRFTEELAADKPQIQYLKKMNLEFDIDKRARLLSGWLYLWPVSYKIAREELKKIKLA